MSGMLRVASLACIALGAGCGRLGFDGRSDSAAGGDAATAFSPGYPRLGGNSIANPHDYGSAAFRLAAAKRHVVVISYYPEWEGAYGVALEKVVADIKATSTIGTKVFVHINDHDQFDYPIIPASGSYALGQKLEAERWWVYPTGTSGAPIDPYGAGKRICNTSSFAPADAQGRTWAEVNADFHFAYTVTGDATHAGTPSLDGFYVANVLGRPIGNGDWNRDGIADATTDPTVVAGLQAGARRYFERLRTIWPSALQLAGMYFWDAPIGVMDQMANGGGMGELLGKSYSPETTLGFDAMMSEYRRSMDAAAPPKLVFFTHADWATGDYRTMRYGLAASLMDDGYYDVNDGTTSLVTDALWFDEFDAPLGQPVQPRQTAPWKQGVWRRDFEGGVALVNPKGNGVQTVDLDGRLRRIAGTQDPTTNNGASVTSVTLADRDGLILLR